MDTETGHSLMGIYDINTDDLLSKIRLQRIESAIPSLIGDGSFAGNRYATQSTVSTDSVSNGIIDLTGSGVQTMGSIPPTINVAGFAFTATTTTQTIYWDGTNGSTIIPLHRADGTSFTVPGNNLTISGLTNNTWYGYLPFWVEWNSCGIGWVPGDSGTPLIAFNGGTAASFVPTGTLAAQALAAIQQLYQGREQLSSGFMTFRTPNVGTSSGGADDGGAAGNCVMLGTDIETLGDIAYSSKMFPNTDWVKVVAKSGRSICCTPNHWLYHAEKFKIQAKDFKQGDWIITNLGEQKVVEVSRFKRVCTKVKVEMAEGHYFWANTFLSHNSPKQVYR